MKKLLCLLCVFCSFPVFASGQSLADAARKERERQKQLHSTVSVKGIATTTTATSSATAAAPAVKPFELKDNNGHNEKYWRERFDQARAELKRAEDQVQLLDAKVKSLNTQFLNRSDIYNKENTLGPEITAAQKQLDEARNQVEQAKQKISDLEDELHKAGGPPGWAR
jgi:chromosome segregation ATPase